MMMKWVLVIGVINGWNMPIGQTAIPVYGESQCFAAAKNIAEKMSKSVPLFCLDGITGRVFLLDQDGNVKEK